MFPPNTERSKVGRWYTLCVTYPESFMCSGPTYEEPVHLLSFFVPDKIPVLDIISHAPSGKCIKPIAFGACGPKVT